MNAFPTDLQIAQAAPIRHIKDIAASIGISNDDLEYYGKYKAKLPLTLINEQRLRQSHRVLVTAMTPTPYGEGKTTMSVGLADGLRVLGKKAMAVLREPSLGPVFGIKGGAAGGGYAQVIANDCPKKRNTPPPAKASSGVMVPIAINYSSPTVPPCGQ